MIQRVGRGIAVAGGLPTGVSKFIQAAPLPINDPPHVLHGLDLTVGLFRWDSLAAADRLTFGRPCTAALSDQSARDRFDTVAILLPLKETQDRHSRKPAYAYQLNTRYKVQPVRTTTVSTCSHCLLFSTDF